MASAPQPYVGGKINPKWVKYHANSGKGLEDILKMLPGLIKTGTDVYNSSRKIYGENKGTIDPFVSSLTRGVKNIWNRLFGKRQGNGMARHRSGCMAGRGIEQNGKGVAHIRKSSMNRLPISRYNMRSSPASNLQRKSNKEGSRSGVKAVPYKGGELMRGPIA